ncbi:MAG: hypothetical protein R6W73_02275 [Candidatus Saliniplasma sp.]
MAGETKEDFREFLHVLREKKDYLLSHHPTCSKFKDDVYHLGDRKLCVGCFTAYPIAIFLIILWILGIIRVNTSHAFLIGILSGSLQFLSLTPLSEVKTGKIIIKIFLGIGIGFFTIGIFSLPIIFILRLILFILCINAASFYTFLRMKKIKKICERCEYERGTSDCPGFESDV